MRRSNIRASVVFPLPDSPTMARVSPAASSRFTSSTALTPECAPPLDREDPSANMLAGAENVFRKLRASRRGAGISARHQSGQRLKPSPFCVLYGTAEAVPHKDLHLQSWFRSKFQLKRRSFGLLRDQQQDRVHEFEAT